MTAHMHPAVSHIALVGYAAISAVASGLLLADAPPAQQYALQWFLLPLLGALCASVCAMLLNPHPEARKTVLARSIFGIISGTGLPKIASMFHPVLKELSLDPAVAFLAGFVVGTITYIIARPLVEKFYGRAGDIADGIERHVEEKISRVTTTKTEDIEHKTIGTP